MTHTMTDIAVPRSRMPASWNTSDSHENANIDTMHRAMPNRKATMTDQMLELTSWTIRLAVLARRSLALERRLSCRVSAFGTTTLAA